MCTLYTIPEGYDVQTEHTHAGMAELHLSAQAKHSSRMIDHDYVHDDRLSCDIE